MKQATVAITTCVLVMMVGRTAEAQTTTYPNCYETVRTVHTASATLDCLRQIPPRNRDDRGDFYLYAAAAYLSGDRTVGDWMRDRWRERVPERERQGSRTRDLEGYLAEARSRNRGRPSGENSCPPPRTCPRCTNSCAPCTPCTNSCTLPNCSAEVCNARPTTTTRPPGPVATTVSTMRAACQCR